MKLNGGDGRSHSATRVARYEKTIVQTLLEWFDVTSLPVVALVGQLIE